MVVTRRRAEAWVSIIYAVGLWGQSVRARVTRIPHAMWMIELRSGLEPALLLLLPPSCWLAGTKRAASERWRRCLTSNTRADDLSHCYYCHCYCHCPYTILFPPPSPV
jgi:hypothetical protein